MSINPGHMAHLQGENAPHIHENRTHGAAAEAGAAEAEWKAGAAEAGKADAEQLRPEQLRIWLERRSGGWAEEDGQRRMGSGIP